MSVGQANDNNYFSLSINKKLFRDDLIFSQDTFYTQKLEKNIEELLDRSGLVNIWEQVPDSPENNHTE